MKFGRSLFKKDSILGKIMVNCHINVTSDLYEELKAKSDATGIPIKVLVEIAIFKELHSKDGFTMEDDLDDDKYPYIENEHTDKAVKVLNFLKKYKEWRFNYHQVLFNYKTIGLSDTIDVMLGIRELLNNCMIELAPSAVYKFKNSSQYFIVKLVDASKAVAERSEKITKSKTLSSPKALIEEVSFKDSVDRTSED